MGIPLVVCLLVTLMSRSSFAMLDYYSVERCSAGGGLMPLNTIPHRHALLFHDITFSCQGKVAFWEFNSNKIWGKFFATVWRTDRVTGEAILVGKNKLSFSGKGYQLYKVPKAERILVKAGDFIGLHYSKFQRKDGMISIETPQGPDVLSDEVGTQLGNYSSYELGDRELPRGTRLTPNPVQPGKPALKATVHNVSPYLRLAGGGKVHEGRAEILDDDIWGTICDKWFENRGWPLLFCCEMGFPNVTSVVKWAYEADEEYDATQLVPVPPIHMQSPKCKLSQNISIFKCEIHERGACQHNLDVIIRCEPKVRLEHPLTPGSGHGHEGIPLFYDFGQWGLICDDTDIMWHLQNKERSWATAICRELNYVGFVDIFPVSDFQVKQYETAWAFPECHVDMPNVMSQCPPRPTERKCEHTSYFIRCDRTYLSHPKK